MKIIKRNGVEVDFDNSKIIVAISKANAEVSEHSRISEHLIRAIAEDIATECTRMPQTPTVEDIQDMVETYLIKYGAAVVARAYITYRYKRELIRKSNTTDNAILSLIDMTNEEAKAENANKNPTINSTMRDYMAGEVSKDLTERILLPADIVKAHKDGIIHFHDSDYFAQHIHNCFTGGTKFITDRGIAQFRDFQDGDIVWVKDKDGALREATVHKYEKQKMQKVTFKTNAMERTVICTPDHRWVLNDGSVTTNLKVGDKLYPIQDSTCYEINTAEEAKAFCIGFVIGDGTDCKTDATRVRLCGEKIKYADIFTKAGYRINSEKTIGGDLIAYKHYAEKQNFLNGKAWRFMTPELKAFAFKGYYAADGAVDTNRISTADERVSLFIEETAGLAGYYISSRTEEMHNTQFKKGAKLISYHFVTRQPDNLLWKVTSIEHDKHGLVDAWCVSEPVTNTFTLEGGIITGNCCLINLEDMLQNRTVISNTMIEKPKSFHTACNITTQIVAQVSSNQYGGQTFNLAHLVPFVQISRDKFKKKVEKELSGCEVSEEKINQIVEDRLLDEIKSGVQLIQYQLVTLLTTNGQAPFVSVYMNINDVPKEQQHDYAMVIEEVLKQRLQGTKNEKGIWVTPAFPKLLYVLDENNVHEDSEFFYLTKLSAQCTAKRMVPDYISAKIMRKLKNGDVYGCMGKCKLQLM